MRPPLAIAALLCAAALAGCGSSGNSSSSGTQGSSAAPSGSKTSTGGAPAAVSPAVKQSVAECKRLIQAQTKLPSTAKAKLDAACEAAGKGDSQAVKAAAREVCEEVIGHAGVPNGPAKEAALKACRK